MLATNTYDNIWQRFSCTKYGSFDKKCDHSLTLVCNVIYLSFVISLPVIDYFLRMMELTSSLNA